MQSDSDESYADSQYGAHTIIEEQAGSHSPNFIEINRHVSDINEQHSVDNVPSLVISGSTRKDSALLKTTKHSFGATEDYNWQRSRFLNPAHRDSRHRQLSLTVQNTNPFLKVDHDESMRRSSLPMGNGGLYMFHHNNRRVSIFGSEASDKEFTLSYGEVEAGDNLSELDEEGIPSSPSNLISDLPHSHISNRTRRAASIASKLQEERSSFEPKNSHYCCDLGRCLPWLKPPEQSENLQFAEKAGFKMLPSFFFPTLPKVLEDIWVTLEFIIVLFDFLFNCIVYSGTPLDSLVVSFSVFSALLALLDTLLYFAQESSCKRYAKAIRKKVSPKRSDPAAKTNQDSKNQKRCLIVPKSIQKKLGTWLQIIRTVIFELVLFPLTLADLIELIELQTYNKYDAENRINFGLFIVGVFFLILTVYFMRIFMALSSIASVKRLPKTTSNDPILLIIKFCLHLIAQVVMHASIFVMISSKLRQETCTAVLESDIEGASNISVTISPFLWYEMGAGAFLPLCGTILFFLLNFPALRQFSISMYIDIVTSVANESFADLMFQGEGIKTAKRKAQKVAEKAQISTTKSDYETYKRIFTFKHKMQYRLTNPLVILSSTVYFYAMVAFFVCHSFGYADPCNADNGIKFLLFQDVFVTVTFFWGLVVASVANYQLIGTVICLLVIGVLTLLASPVLILLLLVLPFIYIFNRILSLLRKVKANKQ